MPLWSVCDSGAVKQVSQLINWFTNLLTYLLE